MGSKITRGAGSPSGGVLTDSHAASLTGADTHAASLTGADTHAASVSSPANSSGQINGADSRAVSIDQAADTLEHDLTTQTGTPTQTNNAIVRQSGGRLVNLGATSSTFTIRLRDSSGGTIITSVTTASIAQNGGANWQLANVGINESVALRGNITSIQRTTAAEAYTCAGGSGFAVIDGSLTGADTHAASLTGADTHAASLTGSASCSACTCS